MDTIHRSVSIKPEQSPYGKVIGVVENREQLQAIHEALKKVGVEKFEVFEGAAGVKLLDSEETDVSHGCSWGEVEAKTVQRYLDAVKHGQIVFAATVASAVADNASEIAKARGASEIVHFGHWVITGY